ncbi:putative signal peptide protein [Enhygromyxa salina]|uniref:Putative signal peptide protein n=1 Tax=Enhygromyxa salina TaxID=215803 RepID=A0A0C2CXR2_9BACT|nr:hypothetical protein [Enhygromyxa salina]KIG12612.1 putative signal peptide protein [Enhygromyxa salina]
MQRPPKLLITAFAALLACTSQDTTTPKSDPAGGTKHEPAAPSEPAVQLPAGAELLAAHVEAAGGADIINKFETIHAVGTIDTGEQKLRGTMQMWWQKGGKFYLEQEVEGVGKSRAGYDGTNIWVDEPITGLRLLEGEEAQSYLQSSLMFPGHDWQQHFAAANTLGKVTNDGVEVWEVELVSNGGPNIVIGLDTKTKLIRYMKTTQVTPMGPLPIEAYAEDYQVVEGYQFSMKKRSSIKALIELKEEITSFEVNVEIDPSAFLFPSEREQVPADPAAQPPIEAPPKAPEPGPK